MKSTNLKVLDDFRIDWRSEVAGFSPVKTVKLSPNGLVVALNMSVGQWHTLVALQPSVIVEFKDGKFAPMGKEDVWGE